MCRSSGEEEKEILYPNLKLSLGLVPYRSFTLVDIGCKKNGLLEIVHETRAI